MNLMPTGRIDDDPLDLARKQSRYTDHIKRGHLERAAMGFYEAKARQDLLQRWEEDGENPGIERKDHSIFTMGDREILIMPQGGFPAHIVTLSEEVFVPVEGTVR
jgi:hypothetical protein